MEEYVHQFCELSYQVPLYDEYLFKDLFYFGLNSDIKAMFNKYLFSGGVYNGSLRGLLDYALLCAGSSFTVGVAESAPEAAPCQERAESAPEAAPCQERAESAPEAAPCQERAESAPEAAPCQELAESAPEAAPCQELAESAPEAAPCQELAESAPEAAPCQELAESAPEAAPCQELAESAPEAAPCQELAESAPEAAPCQELAESAPEAAPCQESPHVSADLPESPHVSADLPESPHVSADLPESPHATAVYPVSLHVSAVSSAPPWWAPVSLAPHGPGPPFPPPVPPPLHRPPGLCRVCVKRLEAALWGGGSVMNLVATHYNCTSPMDYISHHALHTHFTLYTARPPLHQSHSCHHSLINPDCLTTPAPHSLTHIKAAHKHSLTAKSCFAPADILSVSSCHLCL